MPVTFSCSGFSESNSYTIPLKQKKQHHLALVHVSAWSFTGVQLCSPRQQAFTFSVPLITYLTFYCECFQDCHVTVSRNTAENVFKKGHKIKVTNKQKEQ